MPVANKLVGVHFCPVPPRPAFPLVAALHRSACGYVPVLVWRKNGFVILIEKLKIVSACSLKQKMLTNAAELLFDILAVSHTMTISPGDMKLLLLSC